MTWPPFTPTDVRSRVRAVVVTFVAASVVVGAAAAWVFSLAGDAGSGPWLLQSAAYGVSGGLLVASVACLIAVSGLTKAVRSRFDPGFPWRKEISDRLTRGRGDQISEHQRMLAVRYAAILSVYLPFQLVQLVLLYLGLVGVQLASLAGIDPDDHEGLRIGLAAVVSLAVLVTVPFAVLQIVRVRRYLQGNQELLNA